ncbi:MAG: hypothetical protein ABW153_13960 [Sedimenticola sp.]
MEALDTGKVRVTQIGDRYLLFSFYTNGEITSADAAQVRDFINSFDGPVVVVVQREASYSLSPEVQLAMMAEAASKLRAVAYLDRTHQDKLLTNLATSTYLKDVQVNSFVTLEEVEAWVEQFGPLPSRRES